MKNCPFCREEINDEAVKCYYCMSSLSSAASSESAFASQALGPRRVVYSFDRDLIRAGKVAAVIVLFFIVVGILMYLYGFSFRPEISGSNQTVAVGAGQAVYVVDQGLIRFGKFAGAVLALFVTLGLFLYGFNLKEVSKEVREIAEDTQKIYRQATGSADEIRKAKDAVIAIRTELDQMLVTTRASITEIRAMVEDNKQRLDELYQRGQVFMSKTEQWEAERKKAEQEKAEQGKAEPEKSRQITGVRKKKPADLQFRSMTVPELVQFYRLPAEYDGSGQCIALIELGGGYLSKDIEVYFKKIGVPAPRVTWESVLGAKNRPSGIQGPDGQVAIDIEVAGAVAPGADIVVYFAPNTNEGFLAAIKAAIADTKNRPSILSISWGAPEINWPIEAMTAIDEAFQVAATKGITVVCAAGDGGVTDGVNDGKLHVDFPASSPWVLACGGTSITRSGEVEWTGGGGGVSNFFALPDWQSDVNVPLREDGSKGRGIPDIAGNAAPESGYSIYLHGKSLVLGGTSAATPFWAGLVARLNQGSGRNIGYINQALYRDIGPSGALNRVAPEANDDSDGQAHAAAATWNARTGWGSPNGVELLKALRSVAEHS